MEKIIVCVKGVPEPGSVKVDPETHTLKRESSELILNPPDRCALELAAQIKERHGCRVVIISMGPPNAEKVLKEAYSYGADEMILLSDRAFAGSDTLATSYVLARAIEKLEPFELVLMGEKSIDGETAQVPAETAAILGLPSVRGVFEIKFDGKNWQMLRERGSFVEEVSFSGRAVIAVNSRLSYCRPPSLKKILEAREKEILIWNAQDLNAEEKFLGLSGSPTQVEDVFQKEFKQKGEIIEGEPLILARKLLEILKEKEILK